MGYEEGTVINKSEVADKIEADVAASTALVPGLVYVDGANGVKQAPTDASVIASRLYWCEDTIASQTSKGDKTVTLWGNGAKVIAKSDGVIDIETPHVKASTNHAGNVMEITVPAAVSGASPSSAEVDAYRDFINQKVGRYLGHVDEITETGNDVSDSADTETDIVVLIERI